jgi:hypothetical protein
MMMQPTGVTGDCSDKGDYSDQRDKSRFLKPHVAMSDWQTVAAKRKMKSNRPVKHYFKCLLAGHYKIQCINHIKCFKCGEADHTQYKCEEEKRTIYPMLQIREAKLGKTH